MSPAISQRPSLLLGDHIRLLARKRFVDNRNPVNTINTEFSAERADSIGKGSDLYSRGARFEL
jgi:hypothetical protein